MAIKTPHNANDAFYGKSDSMLVLHGMETDGKEMRLPNPFFDQKISAKINARFSDSNRGQFLDHWLDNHSHDF